MIFIYKWVCKNGYISIWGVDETGSTQTIQLLQEDFILLEGQENSRPLSGIQCLENKSFIDEYGDGETYTNLYLLPTGPDINVETLHEIGKQPERYHYKKSFLNQTDSIHKYFIFKNIPYYSGWFDLETLAPIPDKKELPKFTVLFYDIECLAAAENRFPNELNASDIIESISFLKCTIHQDQVTIIKSTVLIVTHRMDIQSTDQYEVFTFFSEKLLLRKALEIFSDPSIHFLSGFNTARFDDKYLAARYFHYNLQVYKCTYPFKDDGLCLLWYTPNQLSLDVYNFFKEYHRYPSYSLDYLSKEILKDAKKPMNHKEMRQIFLNINTVPIEQVNRVLEYNYHDSFITMKLFNEGKILDFTLNISATCYLNIERVILAGKSELLNGYVFIESYRNGYLINNNKRKELSDSSSTYQGAIVFLEKPGVYSNVSVLDFKSLYPSIISSKNLSPSTCSEHTTPPEDPETYFCTQLSEHRYCWSLKKTEKIGVFPLICQRLLERREEVRTQLRQENLSNAEKQFYKYLQLAIKIINNSLYGQLGSKYSRFYCKIVAEAVTAHSRHTILSARDYFEDQQIKCIFIDTDSVFLITKTEAMGRALAVEINNHINIPELIMEYECFYQTLFMYSKKKYYGLIGDHYKASGFELKKKDFPQHGKAILQKVLLWVLHEKEKLLSEKYALVQALFRFDLCQKYELFSKVITLKALYKYKPQCAAPHVQFIKRLKEKTPILQGQFVSLLTSPLSHHLKKGYALGLVDDNKKISGQKETIPVNLAHCMKGACVLFDKIYQIIFQEASPFFKPYLETIEKYNLVVFELKCIFQSAIVTFDKKFCLKIPDLKKKRKQPLTLHAYLKRVKKS